MRAFLSIILASEFIILGLLNSNHLLDKLLVCQLASLSQLLPKTQIGSDSLGSSITRAFERSPQWSFQSKGKGSSNSSKTLLQSHQDFFGGMNGYLSVGILHVKAQTRLGNLTEELWKMIPSSYESLPDII